MARAVAINVGANTNEPGFRGPIWPDGRFAFVPIPEQEPTVEPPPTYAELGLDLPFDLPPGVAEQPVHLDPEFAAYPFGERYTYGDPWGVKARPILDLSAGDYLFFYATLDPVREGDGGDGWVTPGWGAYLIGHFRLARDPVPGEAVESLPAAERARFANNAHRRRDPFDAAVLVAGDARSRLYDVAAPLSGETGTAANDVVTEWSADSGAGPWWRRPLRFGPEETERLLEYVSRESYDSDSAPA